MVRRIITVVVGLGIGFLLAFAFFAVSGPREVRTFPALSGRVVDTANILSADERAALESKLGALQSRSGVQLVVASVTSLGGQEIEPFANALFRAWKLGDAKKNNGVLFLIAPNEHHVRIEVGYGLEGTLTDAASKIIIANAVTPRFKAGDFNGGVARGVDDIIAVLTTDAVVVLTSQSCELRGSCTDPAHGPQTVEPPVFAIAGMITFFLACFVFIFWVVTHSRTSGGGSSGSDGWSSGGGSSGGGGASGGSGASNSGSFSGGGGSSGGGGASDSW